MKEKFELFRELGEFTIPGNYAFETEISSLYHKDFCDFNINLTDANYSKSSHVLKPGDKISINVFKQIASEKTTFEERLDFLRNQPGNIFIGGKGIPLVFKYKSDMLLKGYHYFSFDEKEKLFETSKGDFGLPFLEADSEGDFSVWICSYKEKFNKKCLLLCFSLLE